MSSNIESTVAPVPARAVPVQRKKKTVPVITKYEESPEVAQFTYETPNVVSSGIPQTGTASMAETLINIIQTKPVIQTPKYKKKSVTVADVVAPKIPKQNKKKNVEASGIVESHVENIESLTVVEQVIAETPKVTKKRAPKKKVEAVVVAEQTVVYEQNIENIESPIVSVEAAKVPKKRAPKKKPEAVTVAEVVIAEQTGIVESDIENIESLLGNMTLEEVPPVVPIEAPKAPKKRAPKKKVEAVTVAEVVVPEQTVIIEQNIENIESLLGNMTLEEVPPVVPIEVPKAPKKRTPKKKPEVVIPEQTGIVESNIENIESPVEAVVSVEVPKAPKKRAPKKKVEVIVPEQTTIVESKIENIESPIEESVVPENTLEMINEDNGMEWFNEQAKEVQIRREPILATFAEPCEELVEEIYETTYTQINHTAKEDSTPYGNLQPIADIIEDTLENDEDDYSEQIMVETFEFNGQTYWIDEENRVLDKDTFQHIGQYDDSTAAISFYANAI
jgi:hypothetical protein